MRGTSSNALAAAIQHFFAGHLPCVRGVSPHTVLSYRDTFSLLLRFIAAQSRRQLESIEFDDLTPDLILAFLNHLEHNGQTNPRRGTFDWPHFTPSSDTSLVGFRSVSSRASAFWRSRSSVPAPVQWSIWNMKRFGPFLAAVDCSTRDGRRDYALIATMFKHGGQSAGDSRSQANPAR